MHTAGRSISGRATGHSPKFPCFKDCGGRTGSARIRQLEKGLIALGRFDCRRLTLDAAPCFVIGIDHIQISIHDGDAIRHPVGQLLQSFQASRQNRVGKGRGGGGDCE